MRKQNARLYVAVVAGVLYSGSCVPGLERLSWSGGNVTEMTLLRDAMKFDYLHSECARTSQAKQLHEIDALLHHSQI